MDSDATVYRRWRSCVRRFPLHLIGPRCPPVFPTLRGYASPPVWPPGAASQTDTKWQRPLSNSRLPKRSRLHTKFYLWSIAVPIFGTVLQLASSKRQSCHCLRHFFGVPSPPVQKSHSYAIFCCIVRKHWKSGASAVAAETNWRRSSAALPQIKNGRADLPVSPNIRDSQQHVAPGQPFCPRRRTPNGFRRLNRFVAGFSLNPQLSTLNYLAGVLSVATFFSKIIPVLVGHTGLVLTSRHAGWGKTR